MIVLTVYITRWVHVGLLSYCLGKGLFHVIRLLNYDGINIQNEKVTSYSTGESIQSFRLELF